MARKQLTFRASAAVVHDLEALAAQRQVTLTKLIRDAVEHYVRGGLITADNRVVRFNEALHSAPTVPTGLARAMAQHARDTQDERSAYHDGMEADPRSVTTGQEGDE